MSMIRKYHNHRLQTKTRPDIIMHFINQRNQFHFERKLYAQTCVSVLVPFLPNDVVEHMSGFVACCVEATHYKWKVPSYLWVMWNTMLVSVYAISVILCGRVTGHNYSLSCKQSRRLNQCISRFCWQNYCRETIEATTVNNEPNDCKLIYAIYNFLAASWCLLFSYCSHLNATTNLNGIFWRR